MDEVLVQSQPTALHLSQKSPMPKFTKEILTSGLYVTGDGKGGRQTTFIPKSRIEHWAKQHKEMVEAGLKIPAPDLHSEDENPNKYFGNASGSKSNFGFWETLSLGERKDDKGNVVAVLNGTIDVPVDSDADKIGNTVQETSIYAKDEFVDGTGRVWKDVLTHISPCTQPIEPGQKNFEPVAQGDLSIAMSMGHCIAMADPTAMMDEPTMGESQMASDDLQTMLADVAGLSIPKGVSVEMLETYLLTALRQKKLSEQSGEDGSVSKPPKNSIVTKVPVVMSSNTNQGATNTPAAPTVKPNQTPAQPAATADPANQTTTAMSQLENQNKGLLGVVTTSKRSELMTRLNHLRQRGIVSTDEQFKELSDEIGTIVMSFDANHKPTKSVVEIKIGAMESVKVPMPANMPTISMASQTAEGGYIVQENPLPMNGNVEVDADRAKSIVDGIFGTSAHA